MLTLVHDISSCRPIVKTILTTHFLIHLNLLIVRWCIFVIHAVIPITPFQLILPSYTIKTSEFIHIGVGVHEGTLVEYHWKLGNEELTKKIKKFWHTYNHPGVYKVAVNATNSNSTYFTSGIVVVQDIISGHRCVEGTIVVNLTEEASIKWAISKGKIL